MSKGSLIVLSGPSGCGKGTVLNEYMKDKDNVFLSVSATTREKRPGEIPDISYYYITKEEFEEKIKNDGMLEYASYCDNYYGTPKDKVFEKLNDGFNVILEIEVQGALQVKECCPDAVMIFILPPSLEELRNRLTNRQTEDEKTIEKRLSKAKEEMKYADKYDYVIVNNEVLEAAKDLDAVIRSQQFKTNLNTEIIKGVLDYDV